MIRRLAFLLVPLLALVLMPATSAWAVNPFGGPVAVVEPACDPDAISADLTQDATGRSVGFVNLWGSACNSAQVITYVAGSGSSWSRQTTPYRGFPVATARDTTATYLLYVAYPGLALKVAKRTTAGAYSASTTLSTTVGPDGSLLTGDIVASGGRWWAVWREHVAAGGAAGDEFDQTDLFQAYTFGGTLHGRQRITTNPLWDGAPALAIRPGSTYPVKLVWTRGGSDFGGSAGTDLAIASATTPGALELEAAGHGRRQQLLAGHRHDRDRDLRHLEPRRQNRCRGGLRVRVHLQDVQHSGGPAGAAADRRSVRDGCRRMDFR